MCFCFRKSLEPSLDAGAGCVLIQMCEPCCRMALAALASLREKATVDDR